MFWTNGAYKIFGIMTKKTLYGVIYDSKYTTIHPKWELIAFPKFHLENDKFPQWEKIKCFKK